MAIDLYFFEWIFDWIISSKLGNENSQLWLTFDSLHLNNFNAMTSMALSERQVPTLTNRYCQYLIIQGIFYALISGRGCKTYFDNRKKFQVKWMRIMPMKDSLYFCHCTEKDTEPHWDYITAIIIYFTFAEISYALCELFYL